LSEAWLSLPDLLGSLYNKILQLPALGADADKAIDMAQ
jgi:hypothetical protein